MSKLFDELKRRKVFRIAGVYTVVGWVMAQVAAFAVETFSAPQWVQQIFVVFLILGFPLAITLAWAYEITPEGIRADAVAQSSQIQHRNSDRKLIYAIFGLVLLVAGFQVADRLSSGLSPGTTTPESLVNLEVDTERVSLVLPVNEPMFLGGDPRHSLAISPDGKTIAYVSAQLDDAGTRLSIRELGSLGIRSLPGTESARQPFFSPDGEWIGFFSSNDGLKKVSLGGGQAVTLIDEVDTSNFAFATWLDNDQIIFQEFNILKTISANGGEAATSLTELNGSRGEVGHYFPEAIPGTDVILFSNFNLVENQLSIDIETLKLSTGERQVIIEDAVYPKYIQSGHLLFRQSEVNLIAPFDPLSLQFTGPAIALPDEMRLSGGEANGRIPQLAISHSGTLAYVPPIPTHREVHAVSREGSAELLGIRPDLYAALTVSPDGRYLVLGTEQGLANETYVYDLRRETTTRLSRDNDAGPFWHSGSQAVTVSSDTAPRGLWLKQLSGEQRLLAEADNQSTVLRNGSWHPDGRQLAITRQTGDQHDILLLTVDEEISIEPLLEGPSSYDSPRFSPDGQWLAFASNRSGDRQIYIKRFPEGEEFIVSTGRRATSPLWSRDGTELYFAQIEDGQSVIGNYMARVIITESEDGVQISQPLDLFPMFTRSQTGVTDGYSSSNNGYHRLGLLSDGRFLMLNGPTGIIQNEIVLVQNWFNELYRLAPTAAQ